MRGKNGNKNIKYVKGDGRLDIEKIGQSFACSGGFIDNESKSEGVDKEVIEEVVEEVVQEGGDMGKDINENVQIDVHDQAPVEVTYINPLPDENSNPERDQNFNENTPAIREVYNPILTTEHYTDDTIDMLNEIKKNQEARHAQAPPLRFCDVTMDGKPLWLDPKIESLRNRIWTYWYDKGLSIEKMAELLHIREASLSRHLMVCKARYDEWINEYGLTVYGNPAQRLDDLLKEFTDMLTQIDEDLKDEENSRKDIKELRKLRLEVLDRIAKYQAIEPPKSIDVRIHTPAEITRNKMIELFPDQEGDYSEKDS